MIIQRLDDLHSRLQTHTEDEFALWREHGAKLDAVQGDLADLALKVEHRLTKMETRSSVVAAFVSAVVAGLAAFLGGRHA
jgi:acyl transferase domain-containing protein